MTRGILSAMRAVRTLSIALALAAAATLSACAGGAGRLGTAYAPVADPAPIVPGTMRPYQIRGRWYRPEAQPDYDRTGLASWYGDAFDGRPTASGERFDMRALTAAHATLPLPGLVEVTNLATGAVAVLRLNDRGPFTGDRIIDLSRGAAEALGLLRRGVGEVRVRYLGPAPRAGGGGDVVRASTAPPYPSPPSAPARRSAPIRAAASVPPSPSPGVYWVQAAEALDRRTAHDAAGRLGAAARVQQAEGGDAFRVLLGPWPDANQAEQARQTAIAHGFVSARMIPG